MKIISEPHPSDTSVVDMEDGQVAIITRWENGTHHVGEIVQRYKTSLVKIGAGQGSSWPNIFAEGFFKSPNFEKDGYTVHILSPGTIFEL